MEPFIVSARKYRPETFEDVVGQSAITKTLENAIERNHLAQALLFTGPRGVGKTTCARILAKKINQQSGNFNPDEDFAFNIFELDAASNNGVDNIRAIVDQVRIPPQVGSFKVYIIDEVHMLSNQAFNAFLKTLEEPPAHAIFILATTEKHKIIPTILSRCQIFDFKRISVSDMRDHLKRIAVREGIDADEEALHIIAQKADGALRDSLSIFDRVVSFSGNNLTVQAVTENLNVLDRESYFNMTDLILDNNIPQLLVDYDLIMAKGFEGQHFINGLASHFRDLMVCKDPRTIALLEVGEVNKKKYLEQSQRSELLFLQRAVTMANDTDNQYRNSRNPRLLIEICLMQLASITADGEKKNDLNHILPAVYFINHNIQESKLFERTSKQEVAKEPILAAIKQHSVVAATQASTLEKAMPQQEKDPATVVPKTVSVLQSPDIEHPDSETIAEIEAIEKEIAATKAPQPTLIDVAPLQVADEQEPYELEDDEKIEMAFDFDLDLEEITPLDKIAAPVVKSVTTALVSENGPLIIQEVAAPTSSATTMIKEAVAINDDLESKKRALQEKLKQRVSKFSLQGIEAANNHQTQNKGPIIHAHELPQDPFTTEQVIDLWNAYKSQLIKDGSNNLASCMNIAIPIIEETTIKLRFPNQSMKEELENSKGQILNYIRQHVNNHLVDLEIAVDLSVQKKYVYTDQDKYVTMVEKNPAVALLQELFDLDF
jgi:DNA polymerase-3 subunit gamma/tau